MSRQLRRFVPAFVAAFAFLLVNAAPSSIDMFGVAPAFAKKGGNGGGNGGGKSNKSSKSASAGGTSNGKSSTAPGKVKLNGATTTLASTNAKVQGTKMPKSIVRQYVLDKGLKQGEVASLLKSWNSLNRNEQAYLNNMDNLTTWTT